MYVLKNHLQISKLLIELYDVNEINDSSLNLSTLELNYKNYFIPEYNSNPIHGMNYRAWLLLTFLTLCFVRRSIGIFTFVEILQEANGFISSNAFSDVKWIIIHFRDIDDRAAAPKSVV